MGGWGGELEQMLRDAKAFVENKKTEFLILKFAKCFNLENVIQSCETELGNTQYKSDSPVDLNEGLDGAFARVSEQARDLMSKGQHTRVRIKFRGKQIAELPIAVVAAAEVASFWWFGPLRVVLGHVVGKAILDVEFVSNADHYVAEGRKLLGDGELEKAIAEAEGQQDRGTGVLRESRRRRSAQRRRARGPAPPRQSVATYLLSNHSATPPCPEHEPEWCAEYDVVPSLHRAVGVLLFSSRVEPRGVVFELRPWAVSAFFRPKRVSRIPPDFFSVSFFPSSSSARVLFLLDFAALSADFSALSADLVALSAGALATATPP